MCSVCITIVSYISFIFCTLCVCVCVCVCVCALYGDTVHTKHMQDAQFNKPQLCGDGDGDNGS